VLTCAARTTSGTPHDLAGERRHPGRVIDEVVGHQASGRAGRHQSSAIGAHHRHTTPEMAARVVATVEERLVVVPPPTRAALRAF
jgi:pyruvoyl-dependent arginine decarboxylase (PvlArgDC)